MPSCEVILDVANYQKIPDLPTADQRSTYGEAWYQQKLRAFELAKAGNVTKKEFFLGLRWFLEKQVNFKDIKPEAAGNETVEQEGLKIIDGSPSLTNAEKGRLIALAGLLTADSQLDPLNGKTPAMLSATTGDEKDESNPSFPVYVAAPFKNALTRALAEYNTYQIGRAHV